jgi:NAD(P)-dependent dehydrogenase (short-subunit alcohol dehydrogenase family)
MIPVDLHLEGKVALVTGASYGIGAAVSAVLVAEGARVVGTSRNPPASSEGMRHLRADMTEVGSAELAVSVAIDTFGRLDAVVNNVGGGSIKHQGFRAHDDSDWAETLELALMTAVRTSRAALPHLLASANGVIVNVSSINGQVPWTVLSPYSAAKAAMDNLTVGLSREFAPLGVRVVGVAPGSVRTPLWMGPTGLAAQMAAATGSDPQTMFDNQTAEIPIGRFTEPEEVADLIAFLVSPRAATLTGTTVRIDGGLSTAV